MPNREEKLVKGGSMAHHDAGSGRKSNQNSSSAEARFVDPIVTKQGTLFALSSHDGDVLADTDQGLYFHDMRYLSQETLRLNGVPLISLLALSSKAGEATFELTNPDIKDDQGKLLIRKETLRIRREKHLQGKFRETITVENYASEPAELLVTLAFDSDFVSMFQVRGTPPGKRGKLFPPDWSDEGKRLVLRYDGADKHVRTTDVRLSRKPSATNGGEASYRFKLHRGHPWQLQVDTRLADKNGSIENEPNSDMSSHAGNLRWASEGVTGSGMAIQTSNSLFNEVLGRSFQDLRILSMRQKGDAFFAAGVPWYVALFGRDSLIAGIEMVAYESEIAAQTLRVLASRQGSKVDDWRDEQPGKILHELRVGEMANLDEIPQTPYFGSVDSTPLFLVLLGMHAAWVGSLDLFHELKDNVEAALDWIDHYGDTDGDGFIDYKTRSKRGSRNQAWKDSFNGVVMEDGSLAEPPIAMPEVQGDVYLAWTLMADLYRHDGDERRADDLSAKALRLQRAFNHEFWLPDQHYYAFCRQADGRFSTSIASNPAHALWTGIVDQDRATEVVRRVMEPDMFSGWGIRTLSADDRSYDPVDYQVGSIWPHDNALIFAGMQRYAEIDAAKRVFSALMDAATKFNHFRLPETFAGYSRDDADNPVRYPVACNPQAWAAGSMPFMLQLALGLRPDAFRRQLRIEHAWLPDELDWVAVHALRIGNDSVDLRYQRSGDTTLVAVDNKSPGLTVTVEY